MQFDQWKGQNKDAPFNIGQTFYANSALVVKRDGKAGRMLLLSFRIDYDDRKGTVSHVCRNSFVDLAKNGAQEQEVLLTIVDKHCLCLFGVLHFEFCEISKFIPISF